MRRISSELRLRRLWNHYGRSDYDEWQGDDRTVALGLPDERPDRSERSSGTEVG
jgi:hypothetical protein